MVKNPIKIYGRIKPVVKRKDVGQYFIQEGNKEDTLFLQLREREYHDEQNHHKSELSQFKFYKVFDQHVRQNEIFTCVAKPIVDSVLQGYNGTVFAYGQTGSGKTFTITGGPDDFEDRGLIPRAIEYVFRKIASQSDGSLYTVCVTYLQIYNEAAYDLLGHHQRMARLEDLPKLNLLDDTEGYLHIRNLSLHPVNSENEALNLLFLGDTNRAIAETPMNQASSRSHCMFTIHLAIRRTSWKSTRRAKLHFVDLAGSERLNKKGGRSAAGIDGRTINEARHINLSLHYLEQVITALAEAKRVHVPYRNCIITTMLRDSIGGNCLTSMVATLSLDNHHIPETLATCRFAQRVALVKNEATLNEDRDPMQEVSVLKAEVKRLKDQIRLLTNDKHYVDSHLTPAEEAECRELVEAFLDNSQGLELPMDLRKIEYCCFLLKEAVVEARKENNFSAKHERGNSQHVEKCMQKLLQQRNNEIAILTELLRKERKHRMITRSPKRTLSPPAPKPSFDEYQKLIRHAGVTLNKHEQAALKRFAANPSHTSEVDNLKAQLRIRHTAAKKIHDKIEENKARIVESRKMLAKLENGIPVSVNVATRQKQLHAELKGILELEQAKYCSNLNILRDLKNECDHLTHGLRQAEVRFLHNFQCWWASQGQASILPKHTPPQEIPQKLVESPRAHLSMPSLSNDFKDDNSIGNNTVQISHSSFHSPPIVQCLPTVQQVDRNPGSILNTQCTQNISNETPIAYNMLSSMPTKIDSCRNDSNPGISALKLQCLSRESMGEYFACTELSFDDIQNSDSSVNQSSSYMKGRDRSDLLFPMHLRDQPAANSMKDDYSAWFSNLRINESSHYAPRRISNETESHSHDISDHSFDLSGEPYSFGERYTGSGDHRGAQESQEESHLGQIDTSPLKRPMNLQAHMSSRPDEFQQYRNIYSSATTVNDPPLTRDAEHTPPGTPPQKKNEKSKSDTIVDLKNQDIVFDDFNSVPLTSYSNFLEFGEMDKETKKELISDFKISFEPGRETLFSENNEKLHTSDVNMYHPPNTEDTFVQKLPGSSHEQHTTSTFPISSSCLNNSTVNDTKEQEGDFRSSVASDNNLQKEENGNSNDNGTLHSEQETRNYISIDDIPLTGDKEVDDALIAFYESKQRSLQKRSMF